MIEVGKYNVGFKTEWDNLLAKSKIDTILFYRDFMDYHSDRFIDSSFLIYRNGKLEALLPGNICKNVFYSHQGLTYGGLISTQKMTAKDVLETFDQVNIALKSNGIFEVIYKPIPFIYQIYPSQEDIYALFRLNATKIGCNISSSIFQANKLPFIESRKSGIRKAKREGIIIKQSDDFAIFWNILETNLMKNHGAIPVHSLNEITYLQSKFPKNIKLFNCIYDDQIIAGCVLFEMKNIVHVQYISANEIGKNTGALDLLFYNLINSEYTHKQVFDFGQSTEQMGTYLNENLLFQKEGFGGRGTTYEIYKYYIDAN